MRDCILTLHYPRQRIVCKAVCCRMVCNQMPPVGDKPSLMIFREVETAFHEFGQARQHMLTTQDEAFVAGINGVEWDARELPSQLMENWCYHKTAAIGKLSDQKRARRPQQTTSLKVQPMETHS